jgi:hypothetical protein
MAMNRKLLQPWRKSGVYSRGFVTAASIRLAGYQALAQPRQVVLGAVVAHVVNAPSADRMQHAVMQSCSCFIRLFGSLLGAVRRSHVGSGVHLYNVGVVSAQTLPELNSFVSSSAVDCSRICCSTWLLDPVTTLRKCKTRAGSVAGAAQLKLSKGSSEAVTLSLTAVTCHNGCGLRESSAPMP